MADKTSQNFDSGGFGWRYIMFVTTMVVLVVVLPFTLSDAPSIFSENPLQTTSIVVNILLTSTIIWFYRYSAISSHNQVDLQDEVVDLQANQTEIMERQSDLMEANHRAVIDVEDYRAEGDKLILDLSNFGNGVATDLQLVILTAFKETEDFASDITATKLTRQPRDSENHRRGNSIKVGEDKMSFVARPSLSLRYMPNGQSLNHGFLGGIDQLSEERINLAEIYFYVRYRDLLGDYHLEPVFILEVTPDDKYSTFEQLFDEAGRHPGGFQLPGEPEISPTDLSFDLSDVEIPDKRTVV